jgi:hypothetical protein
MQRIRTWLGVGVMGLAIFAAWQAWSSGQQATGPTAKAKDPIAATREALAANRLEFEVVESYDAKYLGDTAGHMGRAGGLENSRLRVALSDAIYRGDELVGRVTRLTWSRTHGALDIEFDPVDHARVCVGDRVWMALDGSASARASEPPRGK